MESKKALSPLVAVVLLILVVVAGGLVIYSWYRSSATSVGEKASGILQRLGTSGETYLDIENLGFTNGTFVLTVRNKGDHVAKDIKVYLGGRLISTLDSLEPKASFDFLLQDLNPLKIGNGEVLNFKVVASNSQPVLRSYTLLKEGDAYFGTFSDWKYRIPILIENKAGESLENVSILIILNDTNFEFKNAKEDLSDLRFADESNNELPYWIERKGESDIYVWVKVPKLPVEGAKIFLYYSNPDASKPKYSIGDVFIFADNFDEGLDNWDVSNPGYMSLKDSLLIIDTTGTDNPSYISKSGFSVKPPVAIEEKVEVIKATAAKRRTATHISNKNGYAAFIGWEKDEKFHSTYWDGHHWTGDTVLFDSPEMGKFYITRVIFTEEDMIEEVLDINRNVLGNVTRHGYGGSLSVVGLTGSQFGRVKLAFDWIIVRKYYDDFIKVKFSKKERGLTFKIK